MKGAPCSAFCWLMIPTAAPMYLGFLRVRIRSVPYREGSIRTPPRPLLRMFMAVSTYCLDPAAVQMVGRKRT